MKNNMLWIFFSTIIGLAITFLFNKADMAFIAVIAQLAWYGIAVYVQGLLPNQDKADQKVGSFILGLTHLGATWLSWWKPMNSLAKTYLAVFELPSLVIIGIVCLLSFIVSLITMSIVEDLIDKVEAFLAKEKQ